MKSRKLSNKEFLKLLGDSNLNVVKKTKEFERLEYKTRTSWLRNDMSEGELQEDSLKYLEIASRVQKTQKEANLILKSRVSNLTDLQKSILKLVVDWSNTLKQSYKHYSDYLAYGRVDDENVSFELKKEANIKKVKFVEMLNGL